MQTNSLQQSIHTQLTNNYPELQEVQTHSKRLLFSLMLPGNTHAARTCRLHLTRHTGTTRPSLTIHTVKKEKKIVDGNG